jgi:hypothetical protein
VDNRGVDWLDPLWTSYLGLAVLFTVVDLVRPARKLRYRKALPGDLVAMLVYQFGVVTVASYVCDPRGTSCATTCRPRARRCGWRRASSRTTSSSTSARTGCTG